MARTSRDIELSLEPAPTATDGPAAAPAPSAPAAPAAPLELVQGTGRTRKVHFDGVAVPEPAPTAAPTAPASRPAPRRAPVLPDELPSRGSSWSRTTTTTRLSTSRPWSGDGVRNTLYRTDAGGEVVAYESGGRRTYGLADRTSDGRLVERPFESQLVDNVVKGVRLEETETTQETVTEYVEEKQVIREPVSVPAPATKRRGWFRRHKPGEDSGQAYAPVEPVAELEESTDVSAAGANGSSASTSTSVTTTASTTSRQETSGGAWEPGHGGASTSTSVTVSSPVAQSTRPARTHYTDYVGEPHPVIEVEGIGPAIASRLVAQGVFTTNRLCFEDAEDLARRVGLEPAQVTQWQAAAQLLKVKGIGKQSAEVLARCGVTGIDDLKARDAKALAERIELYLAARKETVIGTSISAKRIQTWQQQARRMRKVKQAAPVN